MSDKKTKTDLTSLNDLKLDTTGELPFVTDPSEALNEAAAGFPPLSADDAALFDEPMVPLPPLEESPSQSLTPTSMPQTSSDTSNSDEDDIPGLKNVSTDFDASDLPALDPEILEMAAEPLVVEAHTASLEAADSEALALKLESRSSAEARIEETLSPALDDVFKDVSADAALDHVSGDTETANPGFTSQDISAATSATTPSMTLSPTQASEPAREEKTALEPNKPHVPKEPLSSATAIGAVKAFSEKLAPTTEAAAQVPFSLLIEGRLKVHEKEALLSILSRETIGIREVELESQFEAGRVLIPRVSEYVGVILVQALRNADVRMRLGPADEIYAGKEDESGDNLMFEKRANTWIATENARHPADELPLTTDPIIPGKKFVRVIDSIQVSINLKAAQVASASNPAYQEAINALKRQMKHIAFYRGANTLVSFKTQIHPLENHALYKVVASGVAAVLENQT